MSDARLDWRRACCHRAGVVGIRNVDRRKAGVSGVICRVTDFALDGPGGKVVAVTVGFVID